MDLFLPIVNESEMHPHFKKVYNNPVFKCQRDVLSSWATDFVDRDNKFVREFQTTFNSSFWELYLFQLFKQFGCSIDMNHPAPDFVIQKDNQEIVVEAVVANEAEGATPEWATDIDNFSDFNALGDFSEFNRNAMIRLSNSICQKYERYKNSYMSLGHVKNRPFIIALAPFHAPYHYFCADVPIRSVLYDYYVDESALLNNPQKYPDGRPPTRHLGVVQKDNGSFIQLGFFNDDRMRDVSAVIFNPIATWGKVDALSQCDDLSMIFYETIKRDNDMLIHERVPQSQYSESIFSGLQIYHNPFASHPISPDLFGGDEVTQCFGYCPGTEFLGYDNLSNILMFRSVFRFLPPNALHV